MLIGCNCPKAIKPKEVIRGNGSDPYGLRTILGWGIIGPVGQPQGVSSPDRESNVSFCNRIVTHEVGSSKINHFSFVVDPQTREKICPAMVNRFFQQEFSEQSSNHCALSSEDRRFLAIAEKGIRHLESEHYELPLPLKNSSVKLPNNRELALRRLSHLKKRFMANEQYHKDYVEFMENVITRGYAEMVPQHANGEQNTSLPNSQSSTQQVWYIPHHGVYHPKKPGKIRVVFDCAAQFRGDSLNKNLLQGPDLTNTLTGVLCCFRQEPVGFTCDIESMFYQVHVKEEHRDFLRFLWWEDGNTAKDPVEYRIMVHLFEATSSPGCANFALKRTAEDHESEFGADAANFLRREFYVDDGLKSCPTVEESNRLIPSVKEMCLRGGFNLQKFISNKKEVMKNIPESDRAEGVKNIDLDLDKLPMERALGVFLCIQSDSFQFRLELKDRPCTRRGILSTIGSIFDPLGFIAPLLLEGKGIIQDLCRCGVDWDDPIPDVVKARWERWRLELHVLQSFSVPRCFRPEDFGKVVKKELHHFSDASTKGYGQCSYLRLTDDSNNVHCSFVMGKSRVTLLKPVTIPRLELQAAVTSVKVSQQLHRELDLSDTQDVFLSDSKVVLGYIANESRRFHVFVANRVQVIQDTTSIEQWKYVDTKLNPADHASRGLGAVDFLNSSWTNGPDFLWKDESRWSSSNQKDVQETNQLSDHDPEVKRATALVSSAVQMKMCLEDRLRSFSDWYRAKRAIALCFLFVNKVRRKEKMKEQSKKKVELMVDDLQRAEKAILKSVQDSHFSKEINSLQMLPSNCSVECTESTKRRDCLKAGPLHKLDPFVDKEGILRVGGRLRRAALPDAVKFPIILPRGSHVTTLIIRHIHENTEHQGRGITLGEVRANGYWILGGSGALSSYVSRCVVCRKLRAAPQRQTKADLPEDRVQPAPPFKHCAVDYFGPWNIKEGRKELKRYGVIFTCLASRAVHLEKASTLETDSFINAFSRFVCRGGPIRQLRCDRGTNFVGASRELKEALAELDYDRVRSSLLKENCDLVDFKMNVPLASHMGGVWERQIRSVRSVLNPLLRDNALQLDDEALRTLMSEVEAIINSRPLSVDSLNNPNMPSLLTPNHLLTMETKVVLPPPGSFQCADLYCRKRWRRVQHLANEFWSRWRKEFLLSLQQRQKWLEPHRNLCVGDIVIGR